jgi:hypothetical protein
MGSLAMASLSAPMMSMGFYGADAAVEAPISASVPSAPVKKAKAKPFADGKPIGKQITSFFKKDESGTSKAEKVAARAMELASKKQAAPAPIVVQAPAAPAAPSGASPVQLALVGLVAVGVGVGIGYAFGRTR